jgi:hypothetical protein
MMNIKIEFKDLNHYLYALCHYHLLFQPESFHRRRYPHGRKGVKDPVKNAAIGIPAIP